MANEELIACLERCGWLDELPQREAAALVRRLRTAPRAEPYLALAAVAIDTDQLDGTARSDGTGRPRTYAELVAHYAGRSWGLFEPTHVDERRADERGRVTVSFVCAGERFAATVRALERGFDQRVHDLVNDALVRTGIPQRFIPLPVLDPVLYAAFISPGTYERAVAAGAIPSVELLLERDGIAL